jgi:glycosyltransferase involved in cell wall biosynthesis
MSRLRFAMVTTFYPPHHFGGDGIYVERLAHALARRGHHVEVIHDADAYHVGGGKPREPNPQPPGVKVHTLRSRASLLSTLLTQQTGRPLVHGAEIQKILSAGFDVIHFHNVSLVGGPGVFAYGSGIKLYTAHEHWLVCPTHILWRYNREPCSGRECLKCVVRAKRPPQLWRRFGVLQDAAPHIDEFLALSQFSADKHREFGFERPMRVFPSFLPDDRGSAAPVTPVGGRPYFLFVGRLETIKGLDDVIPQFDADMPADLWIAGSGKEEQNLRELAKGRANVRFLGYQSPEQLKTLYRGAIACVAPSRCFEVFPLVLLEAFREGTPIIARRLGPFPEVVDATGAGLLFDSHEQLRTQLLHLAGNAGLRQRLGNAARQAFNRTWSEGVVMSEYFALIRQIATRRGMTSLLEKLEPPGAPPSLLHANMAH